MGGKRLRVEALLAAAASPRLHPSPTWCRTRPWPTCLPGGPARACWPCCPGADLYLQDEVEVALHPTLTRVWCRKGRRGQRLVEAPGTNRKRYGFGLVDWRDGWFDWALAAGRRAAPFCAQLRRALARSAARGRIGHRAAGQPRHPHPAGLAACCGRCWPRPGERLVLVYTPPYDPDANRIEWLWRALRRAVTHNHQRETLDPLLADADQWARDLTPAAVLRQIGSPFAPDQRARSEELDHAA